MKLQTSNTAYDLFDVRPGTDEASAQTRILNPADTSDIIVMHDLSEIGTHTMRVSISYTDARTNEPKTLRKFYRFNVLSALSIDARCKLVGASLMVQCTIKNVTKTALYITEVSYPASKSTFNNIFCSLCKFVSLKLRFDSVSEKVKSVKKLSELCLNESLSSADDPLSVLLKCPQNPYLLPDEVYADTFVISVATTSEAQLSKSFGTIVAAWSSSMGENGFVRSDEVHAAAFRIERQTSKLSVKVECVYCPREAQVAVPFSVKLRVWNLETLPISAQLHSKASLEDPSGLVLTGLSCNNLGIIEPDSSVDSELKICSLGSGMHDMKSLVIVDSISGKEYNEESCFKVFVHESSKSTVTSFD